MRVILPLLLLLAGCGHAGGPSAPPPSVPGPSAPPTLPAGHPGVGAYSASVVGVPVGLFASQTTLSVTFTETDFSVSPSIGTMVVPLFNGQAVRGGRTYDISYDPTTRRVRIKDAFDNSLADGSWVLPVMAG